MAQTQPPTADPKAFYGYLFTQKQPTKVLDALLRGIAEYICESIGNRDDRNLSPAKMAGFYKAVGGNYDSLFVEVPYSSISWIYASIGCQHTLQPTADFYKPPSIPALTPMGFARWQSIEILLGPEEHVPFIQFAVNNFDIKNPDTGESFPKNIPTEAFPLKADAEIEAWHSACAEKLRQQATPTDEDARLHHHNMSPRPKVQTGYAHVRPAYASRTESRDYFGPSKPSARPIPYQHVSGTGPTSGRPTRPGLSSSPGHRQRQFLAPEEVESPRSGRSRRRSSVPDATSPLSSPQNGDSPTLGPPMHDTKRRHSHPRHARRGSYSSDASSEPDNPPSPRSRSRHADGSSGPRAHHRLRRGDAPPIRVAFAPTPTSPPVAPTSPDPRPPPPPPRPRDDRDKDDDGARMSYPIPVDLSGKLSAPFLLGRRDRDYSRPSTGGSGGNSANARSSKVGWKDLSGADVQSALRQSSQSSEDDRGGERHGVRDRDSASRRHSREDVGKESGSSESKRREREREKDRSEGRTLKNRHLSYGDPLPRRERDRDRDREKDRDRDRERDGDREKDWDRDRDRDRDADGRTYRDRYHTLAR